VSAGAYGQFIDDRIASSTTPADPTTGRIRKSPGYFIANLTAKRAISERIDLQVNVYNIGNKYYIDQVHPGHLVPGAGRSAKVSLNFRLR
jgi:catecholate siderophore receptor